jgi:DNA invertase Pin-like site-specific DNA recombinase
MRVETVAEGMFIAYYRVSTERQGRSGLGLNAQRKAVADFLNGGRWELLEEFVEVESGKRSDRLELAKALKACRARRATLVIAKLDRLARDAHFLLGLQKAGVDFVAADMPTANRLTVGIMALVAEEEARMISARTKAALAAAKARGAKLGFANPARLDRHEVSAKGVAAVTAAADQHAANVLPIVRTIQAAGVVSLHGVADALNARGIHTARGGKWYAATVRNMLLRWQEPA